MTVKDRFLHYIAFPTMSDESSTSCPSTEKQFALANCLTEELRTLGLTADCDENGYVWAEIPANTENPLPVIGLIAHMDTSDACADTPIHAREVLYDGTEIVLNDEKHIVLSENTYASLGRYRGKHLIVTDGTTLLGADDKAGIAEIISAAEVLLRTDAEHGVIKLAFTPDEEIGRGADRFDVKKFGADFAYTVDGGTLGGIEYENFNAASADIEISGCSIHPGDAKGKMINAALLACEINELLPKEQIPAMTEGYEGFIHLTELEGTCEHACIRYIIRDHDRKKFEAKKEAVMAAVKTVNAKWSCQAAKAVIRDSYYNMREVLEDQMEIVERAKRSMGACGVQPMITPIRGGTDGARLSFEGLPCPNLSTGGENYHSRFEYACVEDMETMRDVLVCICTQG
ncbi:MAG: peptidase T [Clostridia bacterium]|nr:peptidase T [Clostridia bacterium]